MIVVVDGNIGSGKSTVLEKLSTTHKVYKEPIHDWPLEDFYRDPSTWALPLQIQILQTMKKPEEACFHERCLQTSNFVFWKHLVDTHVVTREKDKIYQDMYKLYEWKCDVYVYLRCSPEKCFENIKKRTQAGDTQITLEYLEAIHRNYETFVHTIPNAIIIDSENQDESEVYNNICQVIGCRQPII